MQVRSCWAVLTKKAKDTEELLQRSYANAQKKLRALQESRHRMDTLLDDYKKRALESQALLHSMVDTTNQRQFILHLQDLVNRVDKDIIQASIELEGAKLAMMQATHQRMKMETMQEKDEQAVKTWERKRDQKEMDTLGLTLFNLKS
ncbi:MAG: flagellar FliJ family protein [Burkholderiaceae bacterium]|jgi:flagellar export protein FliJ|nr:flagellar FliJ family protein [Burkholderiaceae bacterium]